MYSKNRSVCITGAFGFIGARLSKRLFESGFNVSGIGLSPVTSTQMAGLGMSRYLDGGVSADALSCLYADRVYPETIYHLAGGSSVGASIDNPHADFSRTVLSTQAVLEWVRTFSPKTRVVYTSSAAVYGDQFSRPIAEDVNPIPLSPYGCHKYICEQLLESYANNYGVKSSVLRIFSVYGGGLKKQLLWDFLNKAYKNDCIELFGSGDEVRDFLHVNDVVDGMIAIPENSNGKYNVFNVGSGQPVTVRDICNLLLSASGFDRDIIFNGKKRKGDPSFLVADMGKSYNVGWNPNISLESGVRDYAKWFMGNVK